VGLWTQAQARKASTSEGKEAGYDEVAPYVVLHNAEKAGHPAGLFIVNVDWECPAPESGKTQKLVHRSTLANQDDPDDKEPDQRWEVGDDRGTPAPRVVEP
jgi:hypothetical protein